MDNQDNAVQIPDLKLANVGDRRRKKSGLAWWSTKGGSTSGSIGARGVLGGLRGLAGALSAGKVAVALLVAALSAGAYGLGKALAPNDSGFLAHGKSQLFVARAGSKYDGDLSNLPGTQRSAQSGLNMVSGSLDGMTPEEREAKAKAKAEAEAEAAKAAADAQANANAGAAPTMPGGSGDYVDPEALAAAGKGKGAGMEHSFGPITVMHVRSSPPGPRRPMLYHTRGGQVQQLRCPGASGGFLIQSVGLGYHRPNKATPW